MISIFRKNLLLNACFFVNFASNNMILPGMIFYLLGKNITQGDALFLGSLKFWAYTAFTLVCIKIVQHFNIKKCIAYSLVIKIVSFALLLINHSFLLCCVSMLFNGLGAALFAFATKLYIQHSSQDVAESFSVRYTIQNLAASISPLIISAYIYFNIAFEYFIITTMIFFVTGVLFSTYLDNIKTDSKKTPLSQSSNNNFDRRIFLFVAFTSVAFAIFYFLFETALPISLQQLHQENWFSSIMLFNTLVIVLFQIKYINFSRLNLDIAKRS